jgi:hypothetical protein
MYSRTFICPACGKRLFLPAAGPGEAQKHKARLTLTRLRTILTGWGLILASLALEVGLAHLSYTAMTDGEMLGVGADLALVGLMALVSLFLLNLLAERMGEGMGGKGRPPGATTFPTLTT